MKAGVGKAEKGQEEGRRGREWVMFFVEGYVWGKKGVL